MGMADEVDVGMWQRMEKMPPRFLPEQLGG